MDSSGQGEPWSVEQPLDQGRKEALARGVGRASGTDCVRYRLLRAARRDPLWLSQDEVWQLVRMALYHPLGVPPRPHATEEERRAREQTAGRAIDRVLAAMEPHMADDTQGFHEWFWGRNNSLVKQVAQQRRAPGGELDRDVVRRALLDQGWQAYQYVASCLRVTLGLFRRLPPAPLTRGENRLFERVHLRQPYFGDLPPLMLAERFPLLYPILEEVWTAPDNREAVAVMHRLPNYYEEMAPDRRAADRLGKERGAGTVSKGQVAVNVPLASPAGEDSETRHGADVSEGQLPARSREGASALADLAEGVRADRGIACACPFPQWVLRSNDQGAVKASVTLHCDGCHVEDTFEIGLARLRELALSDN